MIIDAWEEIDRAVQKIDAARTIRNTLPGLSAQQSYLAMYAAARARLAAEGMEDRGSHKSTQQALLSIYREDRTEQNPGKILQRNYVYKQLDDYGIAPGGGSRQVDPEEASNVMNDAIDFIAVIRDDVEKVLGPRPEPGLESDASERHARLAARDAHLRRGGVADS